MTALPPPVLPIVTFSGVSKWFGDIVAVSEVSFSVGPGITALAVTEERAPGVAQPTEAPIGQVRI